MEYDKTLFDWDKITIQKYYDITDVINDEEIDDLEKQIEIASIIVDCDVEEIWNMPVQDSTDMLRKISFLSEFSLIKNYKPKKVNICNTEVDVVTDVNKISLTQYVDFQNIVKEPDKHKLHKLLSVFLIPKGKAYNTDYDILEFQNAIKDNMTFKEAESMLNFIGLQYIKSMKCSLKCCSKVIMREKNKEKQKEMIEKYNLTVEKIKMIFLHGCI